MPRNPERRLAVAVAAGFVVLAALAIGLASVLEFTLAPQASLDPHRTGFAIALGVAFVFCLVALSQVRAAAHTTSAWPVAALCLALAALALVALVVVAFASRLGG